jgi:hypothetical protein
MDASYIAKRRRPWQWVRQETRRRLGRAGSSAVLIPVPAATQVVALVGGDTDLPPHVTLLYPFVVPRRLDAAVEASLGEALATVRTFEFRLARIASFPGVLYLVPEPADAFVRLTRAVWSRFPSCQPYGGGYSDIIPHLTIGEDTTVPEKLSAVEALLPIETSAEEAWLMVTNGNGSWSTRRRFPLGCPRDRAG